LFDILSFNILLFNIFVVRHFVIRHFVIRHFVVRHFGLRKRSSAPLPVIIEIAALKRLNYFDSPHFSLSASATRCVDEKITQNAALIFFCQNWRMNITVLKSSQQSGTTFAIKKLPKTSDRPIGENSPNLVTLLSASASDWSQLFETYLIKTLAPGRLELKSVYLTLSETTFKGRVRFRQQPEMLSRCGRGTGLPDFSWHNIPNRAKYTKMTKTYIYVPLGHKTYHMAIKYTKWQ
jgi:hypothetical protein